MTTTTHLLTSESTFTTTKADVRDSDRLNSHACKSNLAINVKTTEIDPPETMLDETGGNLSKHRSNFSTTSEQSGQTGIVSLVRAGIQSGRAERKFRTIEDLPQKDVNPIQRPPTQFRRVEIPTPRTNSMPVGSMMACSNTTLEGEERANGDNHNHWSYQDRMHKMHMDWLAKPRVVCHHGSTLNSIVPTPCGTCTRHTRTASW